MDKKKIKVRALYIVLALLVIHLAREMYIALAIYNYLQAPAESYWLAYMPAFFIFLAVYFLIKKSNGASQPILHLSFEKISLLKVLVFGILIGVIEAPVFIGASAFSAWVMANLWPELSVFFYGFGASLMAITEYPVHIILLGILVKGVIVPVYEELYFRALLINALLAKYSIMMAIIISSVVFALFHKPGYMLSVLLSGFMFAFLYVKYQNILLPIIFHAASNMLLYLYEHAGGLEKFKDKSIEEAQSIFAWTSELGLTSICLLLLFWIFWKEKIFILDADSRPMDASKI